MVGVVGIPEFSLTTETIGQSYEGTDLRIAKICRGGCGNKPAMYIEGGIHVGILLIELNVFQLFIFHGRLENGCHRLW